MKFVSATTFCTFNFILFDESFVFIGLVVSSECTSLVCIDLFVVSIWSSWLSIKKAVEEQHTVH